MAESLTLERPTALDDHEMATIAASFERRAPQDLLRWAIDCFGSRLALATSFQADGMALLDMAYRIDPGMRVLTIDSGRLRQETYDFIDQVRERYAIPIEVYSPQAADLEAFVGEHGPNPFYRSLELRVRCCEIRKVSPLTRALSGLEAWISGQRRDHLATRRSIRSDRVDAEAGHLPEVGRDLLQRGEQIALRVGRKCPVGDALDEEAFIAGAQEFPVRDDARG